MTGRMEIDDKYTDKTNSILENSPDYLKAFYYAKRDLSVRTLNTYMKILYKFVTDTNKRIDRITCTDIDSYFSKMIDHKCSKSHCATTHTALKHLFTFLEDRKYIKDNPMVDIPRAKIKKNNSVRTDYLTREEVILFLKEIENENNHFKKIRNRAIVNLFLQTGMRISALRELNLDDISLKDASVHIVTKGEKEQLFTGVENAIECIRQYLLERTKYANAGCAALFVTENGGRIHENTIRYIISTYSKRITNKIVTPHKLRASYCTMLYEDGVDLYVLQKLMGHEAMSTTEIYIRGQQNQSADAAARIAKILAI